MEAPEQPEKVTPVAPAPTLLVYQLVAVEVAALAHRVVMVLVALQARGAQEVRPQLPLDLALALFMQAVVAEEETGIGLGEPGAAEMP